MLFDWLSPIADLRSFIMDFLMVNFLTESGGLVEIFNRAMTDGSLGFKFEFMGAPVF